MSRRAFFIAGSVVRKEKRPVSGPEAIGNVASGGEVGMKSSGLGWKPGIGFGREPDQGRDGRKIDGKMIDIEAIPENLPSLQAFVEDQLGAAGCRMKELLQISVAVEEIFVNIAHYAYGKATGRAKVFVKLTGDPATVTITFVDQGTPYNPLLKEDPDVTLSARDRQVGGLGIFMTKKAMDEVQYEYRNGCNILTLKKRLT